MQENVRVGNPARCEALHVGVVFFVCQDWVEAIPLALVCMYRVATVIIHVASFPPPPEDFF